MILNQKWLVGGTIFVLFNLMLLIVFGDNGLVELVRLQNERQALTEENEALAGENVELYRIIGRLKDDPVYIESVARNELGMVGKDDLIVVPAPERVDDGQ